MGGLRVLRSTNAAGLIELSLVAAVATVLVIRLILQLSGYPQLGGGGLHIAHVLYGGLIMAAVYFLTKVPVTIRVQTDATGLDHDAGNADLAHVMQLIAAAASGLCVLAGAVATPAA